jgi:chromosome partitioning protein
MIHRITLLLGKDFCMDAPTAQAPTFEPLDEVISVLHTKGGAGKSSLTTNVAFELARLGYKILVIDLDRQTGQSVGFGLGSVTFTNRGPGSDIGAVLRGDLPLADAIIEDIYPGLDLLPAEEGSLMQAEHELADLGPEGTVRLFEILHESKKRWDVVFIDTPGRKTDILEVALAASTGVLIPAIPEGGPVSELSSVLRHVAKAKELYGSVDVYGIVRMRVGGNSRYRRLAEEQTKEVAAAFGAPVLKNKVPEDAKFGEAHLAREPIGAYAESARSAIAYKFIAAELVALRGWASRTGDVHQSHDPNLAPLEGVASPIAATAAFAGQSRAAPIEATASTTASTAVPAGVSPVAPVAPITPTLVEPGSLPGRPATATAVGVPAAVQSQTAPSSVPPTTEPPSAPPIAVPVPEAAFAASVAGVEPGVVTELAPLDTAPGEFTVVPSPSAPAAGRPPARPAPRHARKSAA